MAEVIENELKPDEIIRASDPAEGARITRIVHMLVGNKARQIAKAERTEVRVLDGKAYLVDGERIEIWDYFLFMHAVRAGLVAVELVND